jgi:hypothetical protein
MPASQVNDKQLAHRVRKRVNYYSRRDIEEWRAKAAELRVLATATRSIETKAKLCRLAGDYDKLADEADSPRA